MRLSLDDKKRKCQGIVQSGVISVEVDRTFSNGKTIIDEEGG